MSRTFVALLALLALVTVHPSAQEQAAPKKAAKAAPLTKSSSGWPR